ncbi:unnamed protein product, partial [Cyprideis torosa]
NMDLFHVVKFQEIFEGSFEVVPVSWIVEGDKIKAKFPPKWQNMTKFTINRLKMAGGDPGDDWEEYDVKIMTANRMRTWVEAADKLKRLEEYMTEDSTTDGRSDIRTLRRRNLLKRLQEPELDEPVDYTSDSSADQYQYHLQKQQVSSSDEPSPPRRKKPKRPKGTFKLPPAPPKFRKKNKRKDPVTSSHPVLGSVQSPSAPTSMPSRSTATPDCSVPQRPEFNAFHVNWYAALAQVLYNQYKILSLLSHAGVNYEAEGKIDEEIARHTPVHCLAQMEATVRENNEEWRRIFTVLANRMLDPRSLRTIGNVLSVFFKDSKITIRYKEPGNDVQTFSSYKWCMMLKDIIVAKIAGHSGEIANLQQKVRGKISKWFINHMKKAVSVPVFTPVFTPVSTLVSEVSVLNQPRKGIHIWILNFILKFVILKVVNLNREFLLKDLLYATRADDDQLDKETEVGAECLGVALSEVKDFVQEQGLFVEECLENMDEEEKETIYRALGGLLCGLVERLEKLEGGEGLATHEEGFKLAMDALDASSSFNASLNLLVLPDVKDLMEFCGGLATAMPTTAPVESDFSRIGVGRETTP